MFDLGEEQVTALALAIQHDIAAYIADHREDYEAYLREVEEVEGHEVEDVRSSVS